MMSETKKCPFCAEEIQSAAIKCKHCGSELGKPDLKQAFEQQAQYRGPLPASVPPATPPTYPTTWPFFFASGPGYWKARPSYWITGVMGFFSCLIVWPIGMGIFGFLLIASLVSRGDWRKNELQRSIAEAAQRA